MMSAALAGRGKVLCLTGEPGIGKTRLADEASMHATSLGIRVYWGRCFEDGGAPAYWPWIQVLRGVIADGGSQYSRTLPADIVRMLPEFAAEAPQQEAGEAEQLRFRLFDAVASLLKESASVRPILVALDDLHDADVASLRLLKFLARVAHDAKLIIVGRYRDAEMRRSPERAAIIPDILRDATLLSLAGLAEEEVAPTSSRLSVVRPRATHSLWMESSGCWSLKAGLGASNRWPWRATNFPTRSRSGSALARSALARGAHPAYDGSADRVGVRAWTTREGGRDGTWASRRADKRCAGDGYREFRGESHCAASPIRCSPRFCPVSLRPASVPGCIAR
jgi:hypothetical protein